MGEFVKASPDRQPELLGGFPQPVQMLGHAKDAPLVGAHGLEESVAVEQALVVDGYARLVRRNNPPVEMDEGLGHSPSILAHRAVRVGVSAA